MKIMKNKLPKNFKSLFWGYNFNAIDSIKDKRIVVVNTLNWGDLKHWKKLVKIYGKKNIRETVSSIPQSEFRQQVIKLIKLLFGINKFQYASRSSQIKTERNL